MILFYPKIYLKRLDIAKMKRWWWIQFHYDLFEWDLPWPESVSIFTIGKLSEHASNNFIKFHHNHETTDEKNCICSAYVRLVMNCAAVATAPPVIASCTILFLLLLPTADIRAPVAAPASNAFFCNMRTVWLNYRHLGGYTIRKRRNKLERAKNGSCI